MPVTGSTTRNDYVASDGQTVFSYTFQILLDSDIKVLKNGTALTLNNDYTVSNVGVAGGGSVTLASGASEDDTINIFLAMPIDRTTEYQNAGDFLASDVNGDFDKGYIAMNQLQTDIKRAIALADADPTVDLTLPLKSVRANKYLKFNALGQVTVTDSASTNTSSDLGLANALDYNVVGDGVADDTVAARNCISAAIQNDLIAYFPPGNYRITGNIMDYQKLVDGGKSPKIVGAGRGLTKFTIDGAQPDFVFKAYGDTTSYGSSSHPSGLLFQGFSVIGDYTNTQNIFDLAMLSYFGFDDVNTFQCKGTSLRMRECWEGDLSGLRIVRSGDDSVYAVVLDYYFSNRKADSACNNINFGKDFQCEASAWSAMYWGRNTRKCLFQGKIHPLLSSTYTVPAFVMDGATNCTVIGANISWKNVKSLRLTNDSGYIPSENIVTNSTISGGVELVGACRRNTIVYNTGGISKQQNAYIATSGQTVFAYTFLAAAAKNVLVTNNGEELVLDTDYTLTGVGDAGGGNVTLTVGADTGDDVVVSQVEDQFVTIAGGADNIVFGNNPSGAGVEVTYASGSNFLPTVFHGKDTVATFESNDTFARVEFVEPNGSSRVGTQASKLILEAAHTGDASNAKISFQVAGNEVAKIDNDGNITANNMPVNVKTFGAVGNGTTDDRAAIQSAIDYAESQSITPHGTPIVVFPSGRYRIGSSGDSTGLVIKRANVQGSGPFGCTLLWGGDVNGTCIQWEAKFPKFFGGFRFAATNKTVNDPKIWFDAAYVSDSSIIGKLDYGDDFFDLFFEQTSNVADACHMNLPKIINCYARRLRFQAAPNLIRIAQSNTASANRVFALHDWTTDFNQLPADAVKSLFKVDMQGAASLTLALSNARVETRHNSMGSPKAIVEVHNSNQGAFPPGSQSFTSTEGQVDYVINTAPDDVQFGDQITITDDGTPVNRKQYSFDADTKTVTLTTAPATGSAIVINWAPFNMPVNGISVDLRDMGFQLTKDTSPTDDSQVSQEAVLVHHTTDQTNVTSDIQMQNVYLDGFSSLYGGNWNTSYSTPDPSDLTNARIKFWSTGRILEKTSQQLGDYVKIADAATLRREAANSMSLKGADGTDIDFAVTGTIAVDTCKWHCGSGSPEGVVTATVGSLFTRTDGGSSTTLYIKESGTGNTGWVAK